MVHVKARLVAVYLYRYRYLYICNKSNRVTHALTFYCTVYLHCNYMFLDEFACQLTSQIQPSHTARFNMPSLSLLNHHWTFSRHSAVIWMSAIRTNMDLSALVLNLAETARKNEYNRKHKSRLLQVNIHIPAIHAHAYIHVTVCCSKYSIGE